MEQAEPAEHAEQGAAALDGVAWKRRSVQPELLLRSFVAGHGALHAPGATQHAENGLTKPAAGSP
jgi:hypothetical protein